MKNRKQAFRFYLLTLVLALSYGSAEARAGDRHRDRFREIIEASAPPDGYSIALNTLQGVGGMFETMGGVGVGVWAGFTAGELNAGKILGEEAARIARSQVSKANPALGKLLDLRDATRSMSDGMVERIGAIDSYIKNGKQVFSHNLVVPMTIGNTTVYNQIPQYDTVFPSAAEKISLAAERASLVKQLPAAKTAAGSAAAAATPAEAALLANRRAILERIKSGSLSAEEKLIVRRTRMRVGGEILKIVGAAILIADGVVRTLEALDSRDPGVLPLVNFTSNAIKSFASDEPLPPLERNYQIGY